MKRLLFEILLLAALGAAAYLAWQQRGSLHADRGQLESVQAKLTEAEQALEKTRAEQAALTQKLAQLAPKAQQWDAVVGTLAGGQVLDDLEKLYARDKALSAVRQLGLGSIRLLTHGPQDPGALQAFERSLDMVDWTNKQKLICATQSALAATGKAVQVLSECQTPAPVGARSGASHSGAAEDSAAPWSYQGANGPDSWGQLSPICAKGRAQAPLDITGPFARSQDSVAPDYKPAPLSITLSGQTLQIKGHPHSKLRINSLPYELKSLQLHRPSPEWVEGKPMAMGIHLLHENAAGERVVLGVLVRQGAHNPQVAALWPHLPRQAGLREPEGVRFDPSTLLPRERSFWSYPGSLTEPPCTEGVRYFILQTPIEMSAEQIAAFPLVQNVRPIQPANGRIIQMP